MKNEKNRSDIKNPEFNATVKSKGAKEGDSLTKNMDKYVDFISWARWNPDLYIDLITPETGSIRLDLDQRVFLRSIARFASVYGVFPRGYGKCVSGDTLILTDEGIKEIGEYFDYQSDDKETFTIPEVKIVNRYNQLEIPSAGVYSGYKDTKKVITEEGFEIEASLNHPLLVIGKDGKHEWKKSEDISQDDYLVISRGNNVWGKSTCLKLEEDEFIRTNVRDAFENEIPKCILESPKNTVSKFIQGLFNTGCSISDSYIRYRTTSEKLSKQVQTVLLNFGIVSDRNKITKQDDISYSYFIEIDREYMSLYLREIGFSDKAIQNKLIEMCKTEREINPSLELGSADYYYSKVKSVVDSQNHVYDLSLPKTNSFVSNGFVSHNTFIEILAMYLVCIFYPDIEVSMSAQTKDNASKLLEEKHREIVKFYPLLGNEIVKSSFVKDSAMVSFISGGLINILANSQTSKGSRRKRLNIEESNLLNNALFEDALEPIVNIPRRTIGKEALISPEEVNGQINFFTTSGFRGSDEFERNLGMIDEMADLKGKIVLGSSWELACEYNRGETKSQILDKKDRLSPIFFSMNYECKWVLISPFVQKCTIKIW